ncbi:MAG TPA: toast rack family protein [Candidatus Acidoferrales bacterium]|nr:toast rack family protein [Candidatus Acidoferrales bacterium]
MRVQYLLLPGLIGLGACVIHRERGGPPEYWSQTIEPDASELVHVELHMGAGELRVTDSSQKLLRADFTYNVPSWKPEVRYTTVGGKGKLVIRQPKDGDTYIGDTKYQWDLQLGNKVPMDLEAHFGAGKARLDLGSLQLRGVEVHMGVGQLDMDLRGPVKHSYSVNIHGGVGQATVRLPADAAIYAEAHGGIGSINVHGLQNHGGYWTSESWDRAENKIRIEVQGGIGEIRLIAD